MRSCSHALREGVLIVRETPRDDGPRQVGCSWQELTLDSCTFYNSLPILPFGIGRAARSNQSQIAEAISGKKGFILQNRGLFLTSETVEGCVSYLIRLENLCRAQLLCEAAIKGRGGAIILVGEQEVKVQSHVLKLSAALTHISSRSRTPAESSMLGSWRCLTLRSRIGRLVEPLLFSYLGMYAVDYMVNMQPISSDPRCRAV